MGTVYEASDSSLERRVAVKLIRDDWIDSVDAVQRFRREARAAAGFTHPNVVTIYDYGVEGETRAFLVMELLKGGTLRDELSHQKRLSSSRMVHVFRNVCATVEAAHRRDLIHRDLKPENIFIATGVDGTGEVIKVLDFGLAKFLPVNVDSASTHTTAATQPGMLIGTPAYMSPEQLLGEDRQCALGFVGPCGHGIRGVDWRVAFRGRGGRLEASSLVWKIHAFKRTHRESSKAVGGLLCPIVRQ